MRTRRIRQLQPDVPLGQPLSQTAKLDVHDLLQMLLRERVENDDLIHAIQKLRPELPPQLLGDGFLHAVITSAAEIAAIIQNPVAADIGGHDDDGVFEIHRAALAVGQTPIVENLQHGIEDIAMRLLDLVEQHYTIRTTPDSFR